MTKENEFDEIEKTQIHQLQTENMILNGKLREKEEEMRKLWQDKEKITWTEEEVKKEREKMLLEEEEDKENEKSSKEIWNHLVNKYQKEYPEQMEKIDISDLTDLALQVNDENIHDYEFLKQFCPEEPRSFFEHNKGSKYYIIDQVGNRVLARCLIEKYKEEWKKKGENLNKTERAKEERIYQLRDKVFSNIKNELAKYYRAVTQGDYRFDGMPEIADGIRGWAEAKIWRLLISLGEPNNLRYSEKMDNFWEEAK